MNRKLIYLNIKYKYKYVLFQRKKERNLTYSKGLNGNVEFCIIFAILLEFCYIFLYFRKYKNLILFKFCSITSANITQTQKVFALT